MKRLMYALASLMSTIGTATLLLYHAPQSTAPAVKPVVLWKHYYDQKNDSALAQVAKAFNVPDETIAEIKAKIVELKSRDPVFNPAIKPGKVIVTHPDHPLTLCARECLAQGGLCQHAVSILMDETIQGAASTLQKYSPRTDRVKTTLKINPTEMDLRTPAQQKAILMHEKEHLEQYDAIEEGYLLVHLFKQGYSQEEIDEHPAMVHYHHFKEFRADQLAAIREGISIGQALKDDLSTIELNDETLSHPSSVNRIAQMDQVLQHLHDNTIAVAA